MESFYNLAGPRVLPGINPKRASIFRTTLIGKMDGVVPLVMSAFVLRQSDAMVSQGHDLTIFKAGMNLNCTVGPNLSR